MRSGDVIRIGLEAEQALQSTLDGFLQRLDKNSAAAVFALFGRLEKGVEDADLPAILDKMQNGEKPGFLGRLRGKRPDQLIDEMLTAIGDLIAGGPRRLQTRWPGWRVSSARRCRSCSPSSRTSIS